LKIKTEKGFTLVELLFSLAISVTLFTSLVLAFLLVQSTNMLVRHHMQAMEVVRGQVEQLKITAYNQIGYDEAGINAPNYLGNPPVRTLVLPFDAGTDGVFGNGDDMTGTVTVTVQDFLDMDDDGNVTETSIDIDGGGNDPEACKPVRVALTWTQYVLGQAKTFTASVDTLIAA